MTYGVSFADTQSAPACDESHYDSMILRQFKDIVLAYRLLYNLSEKRQRPSIHTFPIEVLYHPRLYNPTESILSTSRFRNRSSIPKVFNPIYISHALDNLVILRKVMALLCRLNRRTNFCRRGVNGRTFGQPLRLLKLCKLLVSAVSLLI